MEGDDDYDGYDGYGIYRPSIDLVVNEHLPEQSNDQQYRDGVLREMWDELLRYKQEGYPSFIGTFDNWLQRRISERTVGPRYPGNNNFEINTAKRLKRRLEKARLRKERNAT